MVYSAQRMGQEQHVGVALEVMGIPGHPQGTPLLRDEIPGQAGASPEARKFVSQNGPWNIWNLKSGLKELLLEHYFCPFFAFCFVDFWSVSFPVGSFFQPWRTDAEKRHALRMVAVYFVAIIFTASLAYRPSTVQSWIWKIWEPAWATMVYVGPKLIGSGYGSSRARTQDCYSKYIDDRIRSIIAFPTGVGGSEHKI